MDRNMEEHFAGEPAQGKARVLATLTADAEHDVLGLPLGKGADSIRSFYEGLYPLLKPMPDCRAVARDNACAMSSVSPHSNGTLPPSSAGHIRRRAGLIGVVSITLMSRAWVPWVLSPG